MASPDIRAELSGHLEDTYGLRRTKVSPIEGGHLYRVDHDDGPSWVARPLRDARPRARTEAEAEILRHLEAIDYPAERCAHSQPVSELDGWTILVTTFVEGRLPGMGGRSHVPIETFHSLGRLLGRLHRESDLPDAAMRPAGSWHGDPSFEGGPGEDIAAARAWLQEVEPRVAPHGHNAFSSLSEDLEGLDDGSGLPEAFVHPDFVPVNAISTPAGDHVIVDWTGSGWGPRIASFSNLLVSTLGTHPGSQEERVAAVITGYGSFVKLDPTELDRLASVLRIRSLLFACYTYRLSVQTGYTPTGTEGWWPNHRVTDDLAAMAVSSADSPRGR